ncbi:EamA family transporter RarD [Aurantiacibacter marinus]|uniref:Membrane protein n=1 Tax=Aurantiacibacter marinus TaxID=874156 RepID=A0A0H0XN76_9SPHN|nr:EamA family transporter RarD [Aurantiacibacter marinus]KLI63466.1 membrane protein [Aurantiacibacter marinus]
MTAPAIRPETSRGKALSSAFTAYLIWGLLPLYLILVKDVPAVEFVAWRTLFTLPICLIFVRLTGRGAELRACLGQRCVMLTLLCTAAFIALNWLGYIWAIQNSHVYAASLGYYILPIVMMLLGVVFLKETLSLSQWLAVALAAVGVGALALGALTTLWVSLLLAISFGLYGLLRKTVAAGALVGLTIESMILLPLVLAYLGWVEWAGGGTAFGRAPLETAAILGAGLVTAVPLILFAVAARALPYTVIGFLQFSAPTMMFILGLTVFGEELKPAQLACFTAIWLAVALFSWDLWRKSRAVRVRTA